MREVRTGLLLADPDRQAAESGQPVERFNQTLMLIEKAAGERLDNHDRRWRGNAEVGVFNGYPTHRYGA